MNINEIVPSRMYSWVYAPSCDQWCENNLKKGGRAGLAPNPLFGRVTVRSVKVGQAATIDMYLTRSLKLDPTYKPSGDYTPRMEAVPGHPCVFRYLTGGETAVFIMEPKTTKLVYLVDGREATAEELALIEQYRKARSLPEYNVTVKHADGTTEVVKVEAKSRKDARAEMVPLAPGAEIVDVQPLKVKVNFVKTDNLANLEGELVEGEYVEE